MKITKNLAKAYSNFYHLMMEIQSLHCDKHPDLSQDQIIILLRAYISQIKPLIDLIETLKKPHQQNVKINMN